MERLSLNPIWKNSLFAGGVILMVLCVVQIASRKQTTITADSGTVTTIHDLTKFSADKALIFLKEAPVGTVVLLDGLLDTNHLYWVGEEADGITVAPYFLQPNSSPILINFHKTSGYVRNELQSSIPQAKMNRFRVIWNNANNDEPLRNTYINYISFIGQLAKFQFNEEVVLQALPVEEQTMVQESNISELSWAYLVLGLLVTIFATTVPKRGLRPIRVTTTWSNPERGASAVEYTLLVALIVLAAIPAVISSGKAASCPLGYASQVIKDGDSWIWELDPSVAQGCCFGKSLVCIVSSNPLIPSPPCMCLVPPRPPPPPIFTF